MSSSTLTHFLFYYIINTYLMIAITLTFPESMIQKIRPIHRAREQYSSLQSQLLEKAYNFEPIQGVVSKK